MGGARAGQAGTGERGRCIAYHRVNCPRFLYYYYYYHYYYLMI